MDVKSSGSISPCRLSLATQERDSEWKDCGATDAGARNTCVASAEAENVVQIRHAPILLINLYLFKPSHTLAGLWPVGRPHAVMLLRDLNKIGVKNVLKVSKKDAQMACEEVDDLRRTI